MSLNLDETDANVRAMNSAMKAGLIVRCPVHPSELVALGDEEVTKEFIPAEDQAHVKQLLTSLPGSCPLCADESE